MVNKRNSSVLFCIVFLLATFSLSAGNPPKYTQKNPYPKFTEADSLHGYLSPARSCYDVRFYDIAVDINPQTEYIVGKVTMDINFIDLQQRTIQIDLSSKLTIDSIYLDGKKCTSYSRKYNAVFISLNQFYESNKTYELTCWYQGSPVKANRPPWEAGMVWKTSKDGKPWFGITCETLGASCWIPCKDHLSDEPEQGMRMQVTVPKDLVVVSNGTLQSHETIADKEVWTWQTNYPINSYNMTFYCGNFVHFGEEYKGVEATFPLDYYVLPDDLEKAKVSFAQAKDVIAVYEKFYGPYPWANEGYKLVESPYEGMEHQTAIAYGNGFKNMFGFDYIIVHETAHEWWGNSITVDDYAEVFIHEGFAMYSEFLYVEQKFGQDALNTYIQIWAQTMKNIRPVVGPRDVNFWDYHDTDPYVKGAWTLHGLRYLIDNDSLFYDILKSYYSTRKYSIVTVADFTNFVNQKTGKDYSWFFNQYLREASCPVLKYRWIPLKEIEKYKNQVTYSIQTEDTTLPIGGYAYLQMWWENVDSSFTMPISLYSKNNDSTSYKDVLFHDKQNNTTINRLPVTTDGLVVLSTDTQSPIYFALNKAYYKIENEKKYKHKKK